MKPNQRTTVYTLLERGSTQREIARITGIDRKTGQVTTSAAGVIPPKNRRGEK